MPLTCTLAAFVARSCSLPQPVVRVSASVPCVSFCVCCCWRSRLFVVWFEFEAFAFECLRRVWVSALFSVSGCSVDFGIKIMGVDLNNLVPDARKERFIERGEISLEFLFNCVFERLSLFLKCRYAVETSLCVLLFLPSRNFSPHNKNKNTNTDARRKNGCKCHPLLST